MSPNSILNCGPTQEITPSFNKTMKKGKKKLFCNLVRGSLSVNLGAS